MLGLEKMTAAKKVNGQAGKARSAKSSKAANGKSLHGEILTKLRDYVVEGGLLDGERIPDCQLCESFGISRTPLREALKVLAAEGLIDLLPDRGARVRNLGRVELRELFDVMGGLEALAGRLACENITDAELAEIEKLHHEMYAYYLRRDMHAYFDCNQKIHEKILRSRAMNGWRKPMPPLPTSFAVRAILRTSRIPATAGERRCASMKPSWTRLIGVLAASSARFFSATCATRELLQSRIWMKPLCRTQPLLPPGKAELRRIICLINGTCRRKVAREKRAQACAECRRVNAIMNRSFSPPLP